MGEFDSGSAENLEDLLGIKTKVSSRNQQNGYGHTFAEVSSWYYLKMLESYEKEVIIKHGRERMHGHKKEA